MPTEDERIRGENLIHEMRQLSTERLASPPLFNSRQAACLRGEHEFGGQLWAAVNSQPLTWCKHCRSYYEP